MIPAGTPTAGDSIQFAVMKGLKTETWTMNQRSQVMKFNSKEVSLLNQQVQNIDKPVV